MQSHDQAHLIQLIQLDLCLEAAAVHQKCADAASVLLCAVRRTQNRRGVLLMAGSASCAGALLYAVEQRCPLRHPLHGVSAVEVHPLPCAVRQVQTQAGCLLQNHRGCAGIPEHSASGDDVQFRQNAVLQDNFHTGCGIPQGDLQRFRIRCIGINCRQSGNAVLARFDGIALIPQIQRLAAVRMADISSADAVIPHACAGILLRQGVQGIGAVISGLIEVSGKSHIRILPEIVHAVSHRYAVPEVLQHPIGICAHLILGVGGPDTKQSFLRFCENRHGNFLL